MLLAIEHPAQLLALDLAERPRLGCQHPLGAGWRRALAMPPIPARLGLAHRRAAGAHADQRRELGHRLVDHLVSPRSVGTLSVASWSNSAESFPWTSMTLRARSSSAARRSFSRRSRATSRSRGSAGWRPAGLANASSAPRSRWRRHSEINDVYRPSRRSSAPLPALSRRSYSSRICALYFAAYRRGPRARSGTSGSGSVVSSMAPDRPRPSGESWIVVVISGSSSPPSQLNESTARSASAEVDTEGLGAGDHPGQAVFAAGLGGGEGEHGDADVGVQVLVVGVGVVGVVLGHPPAKADPDQQVAMDQPDQVVGPAAAEDLTVAGVVADKGQLGRHHGKVGGHQQLPPGRTQQDKGGQAGGQQAQVAAHPGPVPAAAPL